MATNKPENTLAKFQRLKRIQQISMVVTGVVILSVSWIGVYNYGASSAARTSTGSVAVRSIALSPDSGNYVAGDIIPVTVVANSGTAPVSSVQARIGYDPASLELQNIDEGDLFDQATTTDTATAGVLRIARGASGTPVTGTAHIVTVHFKVKAEVTVHTAVRILPDFTSLIAASSGSNILVSTSSASYVIRGR